MNKKEGQKHMINMPSEIDSEFWYDPNYLSKSPLIIVCPFKLNKNGIVKGVLMSEDIEIYQNRYFNIEGTDEGVENDYYVGFDQDQLIRVTIPEEDNPFE